MPEPQITYTYRAGQKILLEKAPDEFIVRALPEELEKIGIPDAEQVSSHASRAVVRRPEIERMMEASRDLAPTHHAYYMADTGEEFLITDRIIVTFKQPMTPAQVDAFAAQYSLIKLETYSDRDYLFQLTDHTGMNPVKLVVKLMEEEPLVEAADHDLNQRVTIAQFVVPTDAAYVRQWHLHTRSTNTAFDPRASAQCEAAWQLLDNFGSADVVVGVTDDGCKLDHIDFDAGTKFAGWGYFRGTRLITNNDIDALPGEMYKVGSNHGTACAGVIAGEVDALLTVGAAPSCRLLPIQWESSGPSLFISDSKLRTALDYVADKVDVLSNSWGSSPTSLWASIVTTRITELARTGGRRGRGIVFLWAAGNENCPIQHTATIDVPYTQGWARQANGSLVWVGVQTARRFAHNLVGIPGLMHVAALGSTAQRSHYSNYGTGIDICAPTSNSHEYGRITITGLGITTATGAASNVTDTFGGTSSATPLVAGIAALTISANPALSALDVVAILKQTASKELNMTGYPRTPPATFDPNPTWDVSPIAPFAQGDFSDIGSPDGTWSGWFGHGRADALSAVAEALRRKGDNGPATVEFQQASEPALAIPDNNLTGIRDVINCPAVAAVTALKVTLDITHTYSGDLRVSLLGPTGATAVLHNRNGGSANDIKRTFDATNTPGLAVFMGQPMQGDWTLHVQDIAARDTGRLNRWAIEIIGGASNVINVEETPGIKIPDNDPNGIVRTLAVSEAGSIKTLEIALDITHSYIGDLAVTLAAPGGSSIPLHQRTGGGFDNLIQTYSTATTPGLQALTGQAMQGDWKLLVADVDRLDVGKLNRWALKIERA